MRPISPTHNYAHFDHEVKLFMSPTRAGLHNTHYQHGTVTPISTIIRTFRGPASAGGYRNLLEMRYHTPAEPDANPSTGYPQPRTHPGPGLSTTCPLIPKNRGTNNLHCSSTCPFSRTATGARNPHPFWSRGRTASIVYLESFGQKHRAARCYSRSINPRHAGQIRHPRRAS